VNFFQRGIEDTATGALLLSLAAAAIYGLIANTRPTLLRTAVKTLAVALLAVLAFVEGGPTLLMIALALSALGDAFLSRDGDGAFMGGLASFLVAHLAYVALFVTTGQGTTVLFAPSWRAGAAISLLAFGLAMLAILWRRVGPALRLPVAAYVAAILAMGVTALTTGSFLVISGALLFVASDALLATEKFVVAAISPHRDLMRAAVWVLYYAAQLLITLGFVTVWP
jgi:uncharacterized membrane protein YhhN